MWHIAEVNLQLKVAEHKRGLVITGEKCVWLVFVFDQGCEEAMAMAEWLAVKFVCFLQTEEKMSNSLAQFNMSNITLAHEQLGDENYK